MGFEDKGGFEIYTIIKNSIIENFNEAVAREFSDEAVAKIKSKIYIGWQDVPREYERIKADIQLLSAADKNEELNIFGNDELIDQIMRAVLQNYKLN